ncbi:hypothetical protein DU505_04995 [Billgrantia montanilacus]|uniref:Uncharacterized protein n=1 Tax=Billgrantia montanilacus TaxID=2282305 RepID=A0A368U2K6_9GAMM|nr:hypothetical protein DU505_04995 [Halomonas montanilacus]
MVKAFGSSRPRCAYLFAKRRGNWMKLLVLWPWHLGLDRVRTALEPGHRHYEVLERVKGIEPSS